MSKVKTGKPTVLKLANLIGEETAIGSYTYQDPEYRILEPVISEEMAEVGLHLEHRVPKTVEEVAELSNLPLEKVSELLYELADAGACLMGDMDRKGDGIDRFWIETWIPGVMEVMVNHPENVEKYPQIAESFEEYGRIRGGETAGAFPIGKGLMRVIPIEKTIDGESRRASYEEVSKYLNDADVISVSDCSCRTAREVMGEGCGHLKEDMCLQLGYAAEYYIRTGRGREITREEAFEIIEKAEADGLVHQIPNLDGSGKTHAICNCCGCSCLSMRTAGMFINNDMIRSNYVSTVDEEKCVACGECVEVCPVNALKLGQKICSDEPLEYERDETPFDTKWTEDKWNTDYRINRENTLGTGTSPCITECPAHIPIQGYIKLASQGEYRSALELIKKENPFPAVCGRICPRDCETVCTRSDLEDPIAIDDIKKFIAEQDLNEENRFVPEIKNDYTNKIAVIGAGPSGLSCAYYLAEKGYKVTVFEKEEVLGGMLTLGIPSYRLEKDVINAEIDVLRELGVEFKTGVEVGKDITIDELKDDGYESFYLGIGAQLGKKLGIPGEESEGVYTGVEFLKSVNLGENIKLDGKVVVIGGGNVAIDVARSAVRSGDNTVDIFSLEGWDEMPALDEEKDEALSEGVCINNSWGPTKVITKDGKITGIEFRKCISVFDEDERFNPSFDNDDTKIVEADYIITSIGQDIDWGNILDGKDIKLNGNNTIDIDDFTLQSSEPSVFAGGDVATGPKFAIDAIALGKEGAISIHRYVQPGQSLVLGRDRRDFRPLDKEGLDLEDYDNMPRQRIPLVDGDEARKSFDDLRETLTEEQMLKETDRCLDCGAVTIDKYTCVGCGACVNVCKFDAISLERKYDEEGVEIRDLKPVIAKNMIKRQGRIAVKNVKSFFRPKK